MEQLRPSVLQVEHTTMNNTQKLTCHGVMHFPFFSVFLSRLNSSVGASVAWIFFAYYPASVRCASCIFVKQYTLYLQGEVFRTTLQSGNSNKCRSNAIVCAQCREDCRACRHSFVFLLQEDHDEPDGDIYVQPAHFLFCFPSDSYHLMCFPHIHLHAPRVCVSPSICLFLEQSTVCACLSGIRLLNMRVRLCFAVWGVRQGLFR